MADRRLEEVEKQYMKKEVPHFEVGDTVDVAIRIIESEGRERIQVFSGTVIARKGRGINEMFTVRRIVNNEGVERGFPLHSPFIAGITVRRGGEARRAKLYYLRKRVGKAVRLSEKRREKEAADEAAGGRTSEASPARASSEG